MKAFSSRMNHSLNESHHEHLHAIKEEKIKKVQIKMNLSLIYICILRAFYPPLNNVKSLLFFFYNF